MMSRGGRRRGQRETARQQLPKAQNFSRPPIVIVQLDQGVQPLSVSTGLTEKLFGSEPNEKSLEGGFRSFRILQCLLQDFGIQLQIEPSLDRCFKRGRELIQRQ